MLPDTSTTHESSAGVASMPRAVGLGHYNLRGLSMITFSPTLCHVQCVGIAPVWVRGPTRTNVQRLGLSPEAGG